MTPKQFIKLIIPPILIQAYLSLLRQLNRTDVGGLSGDYRAWYEAVQASTGYESDIILEKTKEALLKVKPEVAVYERDSVIFDEIQYAWPLLAGLMWVAAQNQGHLNVLDFGGSLGSTYFQNRTFLAALPALRWNIVEQPNHVKIGTEYFEDDRLKFFSSVSDCLASSQPNVVILGGVLQYLEQPYDVLGKLMELRCEHIIIDRTPFWEGPNDRLCVQHVPPSIYRASYPSWIFSVSQFSSVITDHHYKIITEFENPDNMPGPVIFAYKGMIIVKTDVMPKI